LRARQPRDNLRALPAQRTAMTSTIPAPDQRAPESVIIRPWPKVVFLYPSFLFATVFFVLSGIELVSQQKLGGIFMIVLSGNLLVFSFDFSRIKSITIAVSIVAAVLLVLWLDTIWEVTGFLGRIYEKLPGPVMNTAFFGYFSVVVGFLLLLVFVNSRFNYYEVNPREILHHHGYLGDITRWSTEGLEMNKEIADVVEYCLMRSGRLIFMPATSKKAIVLDNVANVNRIEERVNDLLSVMAVRMNQVPGPG
jgi:hypothetical protein